MTTVILGSGNVAWHLAHALKQAEIPLIQIFGRNEIALRELSEAIEVPYSTEELLKADFYLICTADDAIQEVSRKINFENVLVAHTSGSLSREVLEGPYRKASFYPLQTFSKNSQLNYSEIPFFIDAGWENDNLLLLNLAKKISPKVMRINHKQRKSIHLAAVFACNFVNHLYAQAEEICNENNVPFDYLRPLIHETAKKIEVLNPKNAQTGPAVRNDQEVIEFQREQISNPERLILYNALTKSIMKMYHSTESIETEE